MQVAAAHGDSLDAHEDVAVFGRGLRDVGEADVANVVEEGGAHRLGISTKMVHMIRSRDNCTHAGRSISSSAAATVFSSLTKTLPRRPRSAAAMMRVLFEPPAISITVPM